MSLCGCYGRLCGRLALAVTPCVEEVAASDVCRYVAVVAVFVEYEQKQRRRCCGAGACGCGWAILHVTVV